MPLPALSDDDRAFLRAILSNPAERTAWLAYADWLDERADPRAEFVRLEARFASADPAERHAIAARLEVLRPTIDPNWVAIFDRPPVENCRQPVFAFRCPKKWERLKGTDDPNVRHCDTCRERVYYCHSLAEAAGHAREGHCVAIAVGVNRFPGDLDRAARPAEPPMLVGRPALPRGWRPVPPPDPAPARRPWWKFW